EATAPTRLKVDAFAKYEIYDYPGRFQLRSEGDALTMARMQAHEAEYHVVDGAGDCSGFSPGARFRLTRHDVKGEAGKSYVVTAVRHSARDPTHMAGEGGPAEY